MGLGDQEQGAGEQEQVEAPPPGQETEAPTEEQETPPEEAKEAEGEEKPEGEAPEAAKAPEGEEKHRRAGGWQRKIERLERQNQELTQLLVGRQNQTQPPAQETKPLDPTQQAAAQVNEYVAGLVQHQLAQEKAKEAKAKAQADFRARTQEARGRYADYDDVVFNADLPVSEAVQQAVLTSPASADLMYMLAKNPEELARISALPPFDAAREIGRLEAKASSTPAPKTQFKSATRPPAPPTSVNGSASSTRDPDSLSMADYKRLFRPKGR